MNKIKNRLCVITLLLCIAPTAHPDDEFAVKSYWTLESIAQEIKRFVKEKSDHPYSPIYWNKATWVAPSEQPDAPHLGFSRADFGMQVTLNYINNEWWVEEVMMTRDRQGTKPPQVSFTTQDGTDKALIIPITRGVHQMVADGTRLHDFLSSISDEKQRNETRKMLAKVAKDTWAITPL